MNGSPRHRRGQIHNGLLTAAGVLGSSRRRRHAKQTAVQAAQESLQALEAPVDPALDGRDDAATHQHPHMRVASAWRLLRRPRVLLVVAVCVLALVGGTSTTLALLSDTATSAPVNTTGGLLNPPATGPSYTRLASALRVAWTSPSIGLTPQYYEVWRRSIDTASYPATPLGTSTVSPYDDGTVAQCSEYVYKLRSRYEEMKSVYTTEQQVFYDSLAPNVTDSAIVATSGPAPVANWIKPLGEYWVYVTVNDNCLTDESGNTVSADLRNFGELTATSSLTFGSYTPVSGGPTYNFRAGPFTSIALTDGAQPTWSITATDPYANAGTTAGATVTVDAVQPVVQRTPQIVSTATNYYAPELGYGEIRRNAAYRVYAEFTDARSGVPGSGAVTANTSNFDVDLSTATAKPLTGGIYATDNGVTSWNFASAALTSCNGPSPCPSDGAVPGFSVTAQDAVGNSITVGDTTNTSVAKVEIDTDGLSLDNCDASTGAATSSASLNGSNSTDADRNILQFNDTVDPGRLAQPSGADWTGSPATLSGEARLRDGSLFVVTDDFLWFTYLTIMRAGAAVGTGGNQNFAVGSGAWIATGGTERTYTSSFTRDNRTKFTMRYWGNTTDRPALAVAGTMRLAALTDAAGNGLTLSDVSCTLSGW